MRISDEEFREAVIELTNNRIKDPQCTWVYDCLQSLDDAQLKRLTQLIAEPKTSPWEVGNLINNAVRRYCQPTDDEAETWARDKREFALSDKHREDLV